jgi:hypothetical protein
MILNKKQHVSKSGKSVLAFRRLSVPSIGSKIPYDAPSVEDSSKPRIPGGPAILIDFATNASRVFVKP